MRPRGLTIAAAVAAAAAGFSVPAPAVGAAALPSSGSITVYQRSNGHGHGMSQYGARGAAIAGLSARQILAFYYPGTTLVTLGASTIRVLLSGTGTTTTVAAASGLSASGVGTLATSGISKYRLVASGTGLALQKLTSSWIMVRSSLPNGTEFSSSSGAVRIYRTDGTSTAYRGAVKAVRDGSVVDTVNRVSLDYYTAGVAPREMPASWQATAVHAQAIAARSYGRYAVENNPGRAYDICDTTSCQVYGGMTHYDRSGNVLWTEALSVLSGNNNMVLRYSGRTIFAQFSASNGGWSVAGGQPYLVAKPDPYDNAASGDPYLNWTKTVPVSAIASYYGLARVTSLQITGRDGHGTWGGRVLSAYVYGVDGQGHSQRVTTTGFGLQSAMGLGSNWFTLSFVAAPVGRLDAATLSATNTYRVAGWTFDPDHTDASTRVHVYVDGTGYSFAADASRPDVQRVFGTATDKVGYSVAVPVPNGTHRICSYGIDIDHVRNTLLRCVTVTLGKATPLGHVDALVRATSSTYQINGWVYDPDHPDRSTRVHVYVGATGYSFVANLQRLDVQRRLTTPISGFGFSVTVAAPPGTHRVCVYGIDLDHVHNTALACAVR